MEKMYELIGKCATDNFIVDTKFGGGSYTVSDLCQMTPASLDAVYQNLQTIAAKQANIGLLKKNAENTKVQTALSLVEAVFNIQSENRKQAAVAKKAAEERKRRLEVLYAAKDKAEIAKIGAMSPEEIEAAISAEEASL